MVKKFILILFLSFFVVANTNAVTYYMAEDGGDAGHTGATDDEWLTLDYAVTQMLQTCA